MSRLLRLALYLAPSQKRAIRCISVSTDPSSESAVRLTNKLENLIRILGMVGKLDIYGAIEGPKISFSKDEQEPGLEIKVWMASGVRVRS